PGTACVRHEGATLDELQVGTRLPSRIAAHPIQNSPVVFGQWAIGQPQTPADMLRACERRDVEVSPHERLWELRVADVQGRDIESTGAGLLFQAAVEPSLRGQGGIELGGLPDGHRAEVGSARVRVAHALNDGELPLLMKPAQAPQDSVQADVVVDLVNRVR